MDHVKELEKAVQSFEAESKRLANYNRMMESILQLLKAVKNSQEVLEKNTTTLQTATIPLEKSYQTIRTQCEKLEDIIANEMKENSTIKETIVSILDEYTSSESEARSKLVSDIHQSVKNDAQVIFNQLQTPLKDDVTALENACTTLEGLMETNKNLSDSIHNMLDEYIQQGKDNQNNLINSVQNSVNDITKTSQASVAKLNSLLESYIQQETNNKNNLIQEVHESIQNDAQNIISQVLTPITQNTDELQNTNQAIKDNLSKQINILENNYKNSNELLNSFSNSINARQIVENQKIEGVIKEQEKLNTLVELQSTTAKKQYNQLINNIGKLEKNLSEEKERMASIPTIKVLSILAVLFSLVSCILNFTH